MLAQAQLIGFIPTVDADLALKFYVDTLGLTFVSDDEFAIVVRSGGIDIRISRIGAFNPAPHTILGWKVPDITAAVQQFTAAGIIFERYPFLEQDANGVWSAPKRRRQGRLVQRPRRQRPLALSTRQCLTQRTRVNFVKGPAAVGPDPLSIELPSEDSLPAKVRKQHAAEYAPNSNNTPRSPAR